VPEPTALDSEKGFAEDREQLILEHLPQVRLIARRMYHHIKCRLELDDLISAGTVGLIAAIDRFDSSRNLQLKTYAEFKIRGAILDAIRANDSVSREDRDRMKKIVDATSRLEQKLHREVTREEIAAELGVEEKECAEPMIAAAGSTPLSLDSRLSGNNGIATFSDMLAADDRTPEAMVEDSELRKVVSGALAELPAPSGRVLTLHYGHGMTMRKIAPLLDMSEWQVQETRRKAIAALRVRLTELGVVVKAA
jgi:RNA polymerase sigma factor FliA